MQERTGGFSDKAQNFDGSDADLMPERDAGRTLTRADLADAVYRAMGLSRAESADMVELVLTEIADTVVKGENVKLSSFGSFVVRSKGTRIGRNPKTGVEVPITPRRVIVFKPSNVLRSRIIGETPASAQD